MATSDLSYRSYLKTGALCFAGGVVLGTLLLSAHLGLPGPAAPFLAEPLRGTVATSTEPLPTAALFPFIEITDSCGAHFEGTCAVARSAPTTTAPSVERLRTGVVLPIATTTLRDDSGREWYEIQFREWIRYAYRFDGPWYVAAENGRIVEMEESSELVETSTTEKRIVIDRSEQKLYAYDGDTLFMETAISTGLDLTPTPRGTFSIYRKTPSRYMQGPLPGISDQYYDLPGVPWNLYFTKEGGAIHGAYWHADFGEQRSHGCVNLPLIEARTLYEWTPLGTSVLVRD